MIRKLFLVLSLMFPLACLAQQSYQLGKAQKKELKALLKEGWRTMDPSSDVETQYTTWHQMESEQTADGSNKYVTHFLEVENKELELAGRIAWNDACTAVRRLSNMELKSSIQTKEVSGSEGVQVDVRESQVAKTKYAGTMNDIIKVMSIYKKSGKGYVVRMVVAKENK